MRDSNTGGTQSIQEIEKLRRRIAKLEMVNRQLASPKNIYDNICKVSSEWESTFNATKDSIMILDNDYKILRANTATSRLLGKPIEDIIGKTCWQLVHGTEVPPEECPLKKALLTKKHEESELYIPEMDIWVEASVDPIVDEKGEITRFIHSVKNITERKQSEEALRESEKCFRNIFESTLIGLYQTTPDGRILMANPAFVRMLGYTSFEELATRNLEQEGFEPDYLRSQFKELMEADGKVVGLESAWTRSDGTTLYVRESARAVRDNIGNILYYQGAVEDITERKKAEELFRESQENYRIVSEMTSDYIAKVRLEPDGQLVLESATNRLANNTGYPLDELRNQDSWEKIVHPDDYDKFQDFWKKIVSSREPCELLFRGIDREQEFEWLHAVGKPILDEKNERVTSIIFAAIDITERKEAEDALKESEMKFRLVTETIEDVFWMSTPGVQEMVYISPSYETIWGRSRESLYETPMSFIEAVHPDDHDHLNNIVKQYHSLGKSYRCEYRIIPPDGRLRWISERGFPVFDEHRNLLYMTGVCTDITERKKAVEAYHSLVDHSLQGLVIFQEGRVVFANQAMAQITGYSVDEMLTSPPEKVQAFVHPDDRDLVWNRHKGRLKGKALPERYEIRGICKDGSIRWLEIDASLVEYQGEPAIQAAYIDITKRKKIEEELRQEAKMRNILIDHLPCVAVILKKSTREIVASNEVARKTGAVPGKTCYGTCAKRDEPCPFCLAPEVWETNESRQLEVEYNGKYYEGIWVPLNDDLYVHYIFDITARKKAEQALRASENRVALAIECTGMGLWDQDFKTGRITRNDTWMTMLGYKPDEIGANLKSYLNLIHPDDMTDFKKCADDHTSGLTPVFDLEHRMRAKSGEWRWVRNFGRIVTRDERGLPLRAVGVHVDITERKKAEEALKESEQRFKKLFECAPDGIYLHDMNGTFVDGNKVTEQMVGFKREELIGSNFVESGLLSSEQIPKAIAMLKKSIKGKPTGPDEFTLIHKNGSQVPVEIRTFPIRIGDQNLVLGIARDITDRKHAEDRLYEYQNKLRAMASKTLVAGERTKRRIAIGIHDDICQKLVISKLTLESSLKWSSDDKLSKSLKVVSEAIGETIQQAESLTFKLSNPILHQFGLVTALEKYLDEEIQQKHGISYDISSNKQLGTLQDEIKTFLFRIIRELLTNVVKHAQASKIDVTIRKNHQKIRVKIQDDGVGFKVDNADSNTLETTRFGLFSVREQLDHLGGSLSIKSKPGQGTTATLVVPLEDK